MDDKILNEVRNLESIIVNKSYSQSLKNIKDFGGADVIICNQFTKELEKWVDSQPTVISIQTTIPRRRVVVTEFSKELSWLFYELKKIFSSRIDYISKYEFYGSLADSAISYISKNADNQIVDDLLLTVTNKAKEFESN